MCMLILCIRETPELVVLQTVKTQMNCCIMRHFIMIYTVCKRQKRSSDKKILFCLLNYNLTPLDIHNALSQVYFIKPEGRIHKYTKGYGTQSFECTSVICLDFFIIIIVLLILFDNLH